MSRSSLEEVKHQPESMQVKTVCSNSLDKQCVDARLHSNVPSHETRQEVELNPSQLQKLWHRKVSANALHSEDEPTPDARRRSFVEEFRDMFFVASFFGVHVIKRFGDGCYSLSLPRVCVALAVTCLMIVCLVVIAVASYFTETTRDLSLIAIYLLLSGITSVFTFIVWLTESSKIMLFLTQVDANAILVKKPKWLPLVIAAVCLVPLATTVVFLFMTPLSDNFLHVYPMRMLFLSPLFLSTALPSLMDIYIMSSVHVTVVAVRRLERLVRGEELWTPQLTNEVADHWLRLTKLVGACNEVSNEEHPPQWPLMVSTQV